MSLATMFAIIGCAAFAQRGDSMRSEAPAISRADRTFVRKAAQGGMAEVRLGELAANRGSSAYVREFGQRMVDDHSRTNDQLKEIASNKGISLPTDMGEEHRAVLARLSRLHGAAFDAAYIRSMKADHQHDIMEFRMEANGGRDRDIRAFARRSLPTLQEHYRMVSAMSRRREMRAHRTMQSGKM
jgi:putative membrane protein